MLREHLEAMRAHAMALIKTIDAALEDSARPPDGACPHPPLQRIRAASMGHPFRWLCRCGAIGDDPA